MSGRTTGSDMPNVSLASRRMLVVVALLGMGVEGEGVTGLSALGDLSS